MANVRSESELSETDVDELTALVPRSGRSVKMTGNRENIISESHESESHVMDEVALLEKCRLNYSHIGEDYVNLVFTALKNIDLNPPTLISGGSSGSYFIHDSESKIVGVFKPQDEEPYGINNPKWGKWLQKVLLPCSFGRGCLVPNQGFLSEAAAFLVDKYFGIGIVPETAVVGMASKVFHYNRFQRYEARARKRAAQQFPNLGNRFNWSQVYKTKYGSFQRFVNGYMSSEDFLRTLNVEKLSEAEKKDLTIQLQFLFVLDYMTRNTDRKNANFLVKIGEVPISSEEAPCPPKTDVEAPATIIHITQDDATVKETEHDMVPPASISVPNNPPEPCKRRTFHIAAIDNGLAFPFKHPGEIRSYPFCWSVYFRPFATQPFADEVKQKILPLLEDVQKVKELCDILRAEFMKDKRYRKKKTIEAQLSVFRGQLLNLFDALKNNKTPAELELSRPVYLKEIGRKKRRVTAQTSRSSVSSVEDTFVNVVVEGQRDITEPVAESSSRPSHPWKDMYVLKVHTQNPYFSCC
ncbi:unnamed protein product [Bursaphelenchus xylophilus]|uniref:Phosphatidylinositol 4-kinase type 2 n=1 Tax=Bursaphelenchus xylophilus TaxID=6326 RepID=A0A1I7SSY6_BURXY|nr:unnamed protein product [Bursaphelenchus xylophilus]CAG9108836.1 unnamed protein product [Bursaphelenchus xylophilus]